MILQLINRVWRYLNRRTANMTDPLRICRERIFALIFGGVTVLGALALVTVSLLAARLDQWFAVGVYVPVYAAVVAVTFSGRAPYRPRAAIGSLAVYVFAVLSLTVLGPGGGGRVVLLAFCVVSGMLLGLKAGLTAVGLSAATLAAVIALAGSGRIHWPADPSTSAVMSITGITLIGLCLLLTVALTVLVDGLARMLSEKDDLTARLQELNRQLESQIAERREAESRRRWSEERLRLITDHIWDGLWCFDLETLKYTFVNQGLARMAGYSVDEMMTMGIDDHLAPEDCEYVIGMIGDNLAYLEDRPDEETDFGEFVFEIIDRSGQSYALGVKAALLRDENGRPREVVGVSRDVTQRRAKEEERQRVQAELERRVSERTAELEEANVRIRRSEETSRALLNALPDTALLLDRSGRIVAVNEMARQRLDRTDESLVGAFVVDLAEEGFSVSVMDKIVETLAYGRPVRFETHTENRTYENAMFPIREEDGSVSRLAYFSQDVTDQRDAEEALRRSEKMYRDLFDNITDFIYTHDMDGRVRSINPAVCQTLGYELTEVIGRPVSDFMDPRYHRDFYDMYLPAIRTRGRDAGVLIFISRAGEKHYIEYRNHLVRESDGDVYVRGSGRNVTERVRTEREMSRLQKQLMQSQKMEAVGTLASGIAHDFNNILQAIAGYIQLTRAKNMVAPEGARYMEEIEQSVNRASELVQRLLTFGRHVEPELIRVDFNENIDRLTGMLERIIPKMIGIDTKLADDLWPIKADPNQLERILVNLATNARDAMPEGGRLMVETANTRLDEHFCQSHPDLSPGPHVLLTVTDTGSGMSAETAARIFEPFFTTKHLGHGTGLGLSTVYGIVKAHSGHISCYSEIGTGTTFRLYFPADESDPLPQAAPEEPVDAPGGSETVLVVDDEAAIVETATVILEARGYRVLTADRGESALEVFRANRGVDLVLLDLGMPGMGGRRCLKHLLNIDPQLRVLIASGYSVNGQVRYAVDEGAVGFIGKPYRMSDLLSAVRRALDQPLAARAG